MHTVSIQYLNVDNIVMYPRSYIEYEGSGPGGRIHLVATPIFIGLAFEALAPAIPFPSFPASLYDLGCLYNPVRIGTCLLFLLHHIDKSGGAYPHRL